MGGGYAAGPIELESDSFFNELGDMSTWFDLEWVADLNMAVYPQGEIT